MSDLIPEFAGSPSHTRCFLHVVNLIAKTLVSQFDAKQVDDEATELSETLMDEEALGGTEDEGEGAAGTDNEDGWEDELAELTVEERHELEQTIRPVKIALAKVRASMPTKLTALSEKKNPRSENWRSRLSIRQRSCCLLGRQSSKSWKWQSLSCPGTYTRVGTRHSTCSSMP